MKVVSDFINLNNTYKYIMEGKMTIYGKKTCVFLKIKCKCITTKLIHMHYLFMRSLILVVKF